MATGRRPGSPSQLIVLAVIAAGGVAGALARWGVGRWLGTAGWVTLLINVSGCLLVGVLAALVSPAIRPRLRSFLGTGVLGGYTTFSAESVDASRLLARARGSAGASGAHSVYGVTGAVGLLAVTLLAAVLAATGGFALTERLAGSRAAAAREQLDVVDEALAT